MDGLYLAVGEWLLAHEAGVRMGIFATTLLAMAGWEILTPRRPLAQPKLGRWTSNLGIVILNTILLRLAFPLAAVGVAVLAVERQWGLLNQLDIQFALAVVVSVIALDFAIYLQHVMFHAVPAFWRLHQMHHADLDFDVTTGARFHPIEIVLSMLIKVAVIVVLGPPAVAVMIFEVLLSTTSMFNHGNVAMPAWLDRRLRWIVVTPDMHRVHHSVEAEETNSNFGFSLPWWDRLFGTYRDQPKAGHEGMTIGVRTWRDPRTCTWLPAMLALPFRRRTEDYAINRRNRPSVDAAS